jgi:hypothetical protein
MARAVREPWAADVLTTVVKPLIHHVRTTRLVKLAARVIHRTLVIAHVRVGAPVSPRHGPFELGGDLEQQIFAAVGGNDLHADR